MAAFEVGNPGLLKHGQDYTGALCGMDESVIDKPKVYYPRLAEDLAAYKQAAGTVKGTASYMIPIYAVCVAECPEAGETVEDYGCQARPRASGCAWQKNPLARNQRYGLWNVGVGTKDVVNRCLPYIEKRSADVELCAMPTCTDAGKACYTETFADQLYWPMQSDDDRVHCLQAVELQVSRSFTTPNAGMVDTFVGQSVGGVFGAASDLSRAACEIVFFGVLCSVIINCILLVLLRYVIRTLFCLASVSIVLLLLAIDLALLSKAGILDLSATATLALGALSNASEFLLGLAGQVDNEHVHRLTDHATLHATAALASAHSVAHSTAELSVLGAAAEEERQSYAIAAYVSTGATALVLVFVCLLLSRLERSLEICGQATVAVFYMPGLLCLPLLSMVTTFVSIGTFVIVAAYLATPEPEHILTKLNDLTALGLDFATDLANVGLEAASDFAQRGIDSAQSHGLETPDLTIRAAELVAPELAISGVQPQLLQRCAIVYELFVALWVLFFIDAIVYTTIAAAVGYWYFVATQPDDDGDGDIDEDGKKDTSFTPLSSSLCRVLRYHLGSMAMGSFVLATVKLVRLGMLWLDEQMRRQGFQDHLAVKLCLKCIHCVLWCFEQCIKYLTRFTYVFVALEGTAFCSSAVQTFKLTASYPLQMLANEAARAVLTLLQMLLPPLACAALAYLSVIREWREDARLLLGAHGLEVDGLATWTTTPSALAVGLATAVVSYHITTSFKVVYGAAIDTLFVCMMRDASSYGGRYARKHPLAEAAMMQPEKPGRTSSGAAASENLAYP